jgi:hypothetical protein
MTELPLMLVGWHGRPSVVPRKSGTFISDVSCLRGSKLLHWFREMMHAVIEPWDLRPTGRVAALTGSARTLNPG